MPIGDVILRFIGRDETDQATASAEANIGQIEERGTRAANAIRVAFAAALGEISEQFLELRRELDQITTDLDRATGGGGPEVHEFRSRLVDAGIDPLGPPDHLNAIIRTVRAQFGLGDPGAFRAAVALGQFGEQTGLRDPRSIGQIANQFGLGAAELPALLNVIAATESGRDVSAGAIVGQLRDYASVTAEAGLSAYESVELIGDLGAGGVDISRVAPALNAAIRRASDDPAGSRAILESTFRAVQEADTADAARVIAEPLLGAEGTLRLVRDLRRAQIGFGAELQTDPSVLGEETLLSLAGRPSVDEIVAAAERRQREGGLGVRAAYATEQALESVPFIGSYFDEAFTGLRESVNRRPAREPTTVLQVYGSVLDVGQFDGVIRREAPDDQNLLPSP